MRKNIKKMKKMGFGLGGGFGKGPKSIKRR
jgi:hypothetical protein